MHFLPYGLINKIARRPGRKYCIMGAGVQIMSLYRGQDMHLFRVQKVHVIQ